MLLAMIVMGPLCVIVDGLFVADTADVNADAEGDGEDGDDEGEEEKETLERTTSVSANRSVVGAGGFCAVGPAVVAG